MNHEKDPYQKTSIILLESKSFFFRGSYESARFLKSNSTWIFLVLHWGVDVRFVPRPLAPFDLNRDGGSWCVRTCRMLTCRHEINIEFWNKKENYIVDTSHILPRVFSHKWNREDWEVSIVECGDIPCVLYQTLWLLNGLNHVPLGRDCYVLLGDTWPQ